MNYFLLNGRLVFAYFLCILVKISFYFTLPYWICFSRWMGLNQLW